VKRINRSKIHFEGVEAADVAVDGEDDAAVRSVAELDREIVTRLTLFIQRRIAEKKCGSGMHFLSSWPGLTRPSTSCLRGGKDVDARHKAGHDGGSNLKRGRKTPRALSVKARGDHPFKNSAAL